MMNGNYQFTERVRACIALSREEAHQLHHAYVDTEHLLLALLRQQDGVGFAVLQALSIDPEKVRQDLLHVVKPGNPGSKHAPDLPYTSRAKKVLELAMSEAHAHKHSYVGTEHLLLGLIRERTGLAAQVLRQNQADFARVRAEVLKLLGSADVQQSVGNTMPFESVDIRIHYKDGSVHEETFTHPEMAAMRLLQEMME